MDWTEGVGESSSPPRSFGSFNNCDVRNDVYDRLMQIGHEEAVSNPLFREQLDAHFNRLPSSYLLDVNMDRAEDVLLHQRLLTSAKDPEKRPVYHIRFLENHCTRTDDGDDLQFTNIISTERPDFNADNGVVPSNKKQELVHVHEVIFSTIDKPKLLSQLSALLSDIGLNIREAHVFSTTDGYSLDVFVVDGWPNEDTDCLYKAMEKAIARSEGSWSGSSHSHSAAGKTSAAQAKSGDWEIDRRLLKIGERIASGSCGDLMFAVKILRSEHLNDTQEEEFAQEVAILRVYARWKSLYYLHKNHNLLKLPQLLKFAINVSRGMEYLHQNNIIHRDLKTANLLMDTHKVINHQPYDQKADIFSFAIVLWELVTAKVPYDTMTPLQAALGVRQGLRPELPQDAHPKLLDLMQRCWETTPANRPPFSEITVELEILLQEVQETKDAVNGS
ncbi:hypothetical protein GH714_000171 [Hevea brasiliensis]|uniref:Protein kinase domain-containing protein n=1 Tax=Hevea brasiliensis TaxID=3981 RepID=A0A6A6NAB4_HEVBR|nr:hypothetical protein GH714_000171 [Hevea brasiliensis]